MGALSGALGTARADGPVSVFVSGEPGIGKTRLIAEFARAAHAEGVAVLYGRCDEDLALPYQPWLEALGHLSDHVPPHVARRHLDRFGEGLRVLVPGLGLASTADVPHGDVPARPAPADATQQQVLFQAAVGLLDDVGRRRPVLLVLDDLQWADASSLQLLRHVARRAVSPVLTVCLYRSTEVNESHPLSDLIGTLEGAGTATGIALEGLDVAAVAELVAGIVDGASEQGSTEIAERIAAETSGNPFFLTEILRSPEVQRALAGDGFSSTAEHVPAGVQRVV
jgi:predicted ATPase